MICKDANKWHICKKHSHGICKLADSFKKFIFHERKIRDICRKQGSQ